MNDNFVRAFRGSGISMYQFSGKSGVPYSTINEIHSGKKNINAKASETVFKLAEALGLQVRDILNPVHVLDGVRGVYRGVRYEWQYEDTMRLVLHKKGQVKVIETPYQLVNPEDRGVYAVLHEGYIDGYLKELDHQRQADIFKEELAATGKDYCNDGSV